MKSQPREIIFLIEDDEKMLSLLSTLLDLEGYRVITIRAPSSEMIIDAMEDQKPIAIVMDVHLASQNGITLLKSLRPAIMNSAVGVLMTSGEDLRRQCLNAGADGFLLKPYDPSELLAWLRTRSQLHKEKER